VLDRHNLSSPNEAEGQCSIEAECMHSTEDVRVGSDPGENASPPGHTTHQFTTQAGTEAYRAQAQQSTPSVLSQRTDKALMPGSDQADPAPKTDSLAKTIRLMIREARDFTEGLDPPE